MNSFALGLHIDSHEHGEMSQKSFDRAGGIVFGDRRCCGVE